MLLSTHHSTNYCLLINLCGIFPDYWFSLFISCLIFCSLAWFWHYTNDTQWRVWHANIYISQSLNVNTRAQPECWHFNWGTHIFARHTSSSCVICFVASLTKIPKTNFTGMEPYDNYVTTSADSKYAKIGECEAMPTAAPQPMSACDLESRICLHWHNPMSHHDIGLFQCKQSQPVEYLIIANSTWLHLDQ